MPDGGIREVTEPIAIALVDDRLHFTVTSGKNSWTYSCSLHKARGAAMAATYLLDQAAGKNEAKIVPFGKKA